MLQAHLVDGRLFPLAQSFSVWRYAVSGRLYTHTPCGVMIRVGEIGALVDQPKGHGRHQALTKTKKKYEFILNFQIV